MADLEKIVGVGNGKYFLGALLVLLLSIFAYYFVRLVAFVLSPLFALFTGPSGNSNPTTQSIPAMKTKQEEVVLNDVEDEWESI